jgi:uncharacterized Tic20 family protein
MNEAQTPMTASDQGTVWAVLCHLTGFVVYFLPIFGNFIALLIIWSLKGKEIPSVVLHAKAAFNYQLGMLVFSIIGLILFFTVVAIELSFGNSPIFIATVALGIAAALFFNLMYCIWIIMAAVRANNDEVFDYPIKLNLVK